MEIKQKELINARMGEIKEQQGQAAQPFGQQQATFASGPRAPEAAAPVSQSFGTGGFMDEFNARENNNSNSSGGSGSSSYSSSTGSYSSSTGSDSSSRSGPSAGGFGERSRSVSQTAGGNGIPSYIPMPTKGANDQGSSDAGWLQLDADDSNTGKDQANSSWK